MKKIGRNEPCPCGSGKKYKNCCIRSDQLSASLEQYKQDLLLSSGLYAPKLEAYLASHDCFQILDYLIALQINPKNHGKNLRIEHIAQLAISNLGKSKSAPDIRVLKRLIDEEYPIDVMEDIPMNMFAETVVFHGGNYVLFPGLSTYVADLFRAMTETIYHHETTFLKEFQIDVYQGIRALLVLGDITAHRAGINGLTRGNENPRETITDPNTVYSFVMDELLMTEILNYHGLEKEALEPFILNTKDPMLLTDVSDSNPILYRPIVHYNGYYFFIGIANQGCAINNYILKTAAKYKCLSELVQQTQHSIWMKIGLSCMNYMHWHISNYGDMMHDEGHYSEELFQIDTNWLAYVCYAKDSAEEVSIDGNTCQAHWNMDDHLRSTLSALRKDDRTKSFHILTLVLYSSMGESFALLTNNQSDSDYLLLLSAFDFLQLVQTEKWDTMSLVRFARTKDTKPFLNTPLNQVLDIYSLYKHCGESFYISDEAVPDFLNIDPNDGFHLIKESKEHLNFHAIPLTINGRSAYIPALRDMDYAEIYKPFGETIKGKCCDSYSVPIWVRCSQTEREGLNPTSIIDTVITAIAFWMDVLRPSLENAVNNLYKKPIEIELLFSNDILSDKGLHKDLAPPSAAGNLTVIRTQTGISVTFDHDYIISFMGPCNENERDMMKKIIKGLLDLDSETAAAIVDERIPYGQAKMILMTETSNNPLLSPLWLYVPAYIHKATSQLLLDRFPQWMKEKGHNITKLTNKPDKVGFLHAGVDVLFEKLSERLAMFETESLLKALINNHETLIYRREHNKIIQPAQILCFGDAPNKRQEFFNDEILLTDARLATCALIEFVAATQNQKGALQPGNDDIEYLLTIMLEIVKIGSICDAIYLDMADYTIELLGSGRYGIYDNDFEGHINGYASALSVESVNQFLEDFDYKMGRLAIQEPFSPKEKDEEHVIMDEAFESDWGVSYTSILQFFYTCHQIVVNSQTSVLEITESELLTEVNRLCKDLTLDIVRKCLDLFSLARRQDYLIPPKGFENRDIFPWVYNRELSYLRRPIVRRVLPDGCLHYIFGFRSCLIAGLQLTDLLYSGRLRNPGKKLKKLLGYFEAKKGSEFNEEVRGFLMSIPKLKVWPHDVSIKQNGNLTADMDYGDIDVLAYDSSRNIVYSIECKNTNTAKNVKEMKTEMDEYLGRGDNPEKDKRKALIFKHLRRHKWIMDNMLKVMNYIGASIEPTIKSMMLTASVIPTSYLKKEDSPLSILNYPELKKNGLAYLDSSKEPNVSALG